MFRRTATILATAAAALALTAGPALGSEPDDSPPAGSLLPALPQVEVPGVPPVNVNEIPTVPTEVDPDGAASAEPVEITLAPNGTNVRATITVTGRQVTGTATGLDPSRRYISLYYGDQSTDAPGQTLTCADARTAAFPTKWGIRGEWKVSASGAGTLSGTAPRDLADGVYTMSIRRVPPTAMSDPYVGFNPLQYPVMACGENPTFEE